MKGIIYMDNPRRYRSFFWPVVLIGVGLVWLLGNLGIIRPSSLGALISLWPLVLILIGLDILFGRRSPVIGALIGLLAIVAVIGILIAGPALGLPTASVGVLQRCTITEPVIGVTDANITLDFSSQPVNLHPVSNPSNLLEAQIAYYGDLSYSSSGSPTRQISLSSLGGFSFFLGSDANARWDIGLNPTIPTNLRLGGSSGSEALDLSSLRLTAFFLDQGSGSVTASLPPSPEPYTAEFQGASGSLDLSLPANDSLTIHLDGGSGSIHLRLPVGAAVRFEVRSSGSGSVNLPSGLSQISPGANRKEGVWQTAGYDQAAYQINILCDDLGSGSITLE
jgi:hypothetical protein